MAGARGGSDDFSRPLLDPFQKFLTKIAMELESKDVKLMKNLLQGTLPEDELNAVDASEIDAALDLFTCLKRSRLLSENNLDLLIELLKESRRIVLMNLVKQFKQEYKAVKDAPENQIQERLPAFTQHLVFFWFHGKRADLSAEKLDDIKSKVCHSLDIRTIADMTYVESVNTEEVSNIVKVVFQMLVPDKTLSKLKNDAYHKRNWLIKLGVLGVKIDKSSTLLIAEDWQRTSRRLPQKAATRPSIKRFTSVLQSTDSNTVLHDDDKVDLILLVEVPYDVTPNVCNKVLKQCKNAIKKFKESKDFGMHLAIVTYGDHSAAQDQIPLNIMKRSKGFSTKFNDLLDMIENTQHIGGFGLPEALGEAVKIAIGEIQGDWCLRREATKLCVVITYLRPGSDDIKNYCCPHNNDAIVHVNKLADYAIPLYIIGVNPLPTRPQQDIPQFGNSQQTDAYHKQVLQEEVNPFLSGLAVIGGGQFHQLPDICDLAKVLCFIVGEDISIEHHMGTVNDVIISEINKQYGDVNIKHLSKHLQQALYLRSTTVSCLHPRNVPTKLSTQLAQIISWADNMDEAIQAVERRKQWISEEGFEHQAEAPDDMQEQGESQGEMVALDDVEMADPSERTSISLHLVQEVDLQVSTQMVRRQIQRSAYFRPTRESSRD